MAVKLAPFGMAWNQRFQFDRMNETDVRENIVVPMLADLGYRRDSANDIITEQRLVDPVRSLGRRKPGDPLLWGRADYILDVEKRWRWVIEVKPPSSAISQEDRNQAWTYACHPEIKGLYYLLTNGRSYELHRSIDGPNAPPVLAFTHEELGAAWVALQNALSPASLKRDFPAFVPDFGLPLGPGLRSFSKLLNGTVTYTSSKPPLPGTGINGVINHLKEGTVERAHGKILATLRMESAQQQLNETLRTLGLDVFQIESTASALSTDRSNPTEFKSRMDWTFPKGMVFQMAGTPPVTLPAAWECEASTRAYGALSGQRFAGTVTIDYGVRAMGRPIRFTIEGAFEMLLS